MVKGSLEVKLSTIWTNEKAEVGRVREEKIREEKRRGRGRGRGREEKRREEERRSEKRKSQKKESEERVRRKSQKKEDAGARKGRKVANHWVFPMICGSGWSKNIEKKAGLAKAAGGAIR